MTDEKPATDVDRGPLGEAEPRDSDPDPRTGGGMAQEKPEDRPNVGSVKPEDYPQDRPR